MVVMVPVNMCSNCGKRGGDTFNFGSSDPNWYVYCQELDRNVFAYSIDPYCPYRVKMMPECCRNCDTVRYVSMDEEGFYRIEDEWICALTFHLVDPASIPDDCPKKEKDAD